MLTVSRILGKCGYSSMGGLTGRTTHANPRGRKKTRKNTAEIPGGDWEIFFLRLAFLEILRRAYLRKLPRGSAFEEFGRGRFCLLAPRRSSPKIVLFLRNRIFFSSLYEILHAIQLINILEFLTSSLNRCRVWMIARTICRTSARHRTCAVPGRVAERVPAALRTRRAVDAEQRSWAPVIVFFFLTFESFSLALSILHFPLHYPPLIDYSRNIQRDPVNPYEKNFLYMFSEVRNFFSGFRTSFPILSQWGFFLQQHWSVFAVETRTRSFRCNCYFMYEILGVFFYQGFETFVSTCFSSKFF